MPNNFTNYTGYDGSDWKALEHPGELPPLVECPWIHLLDKAICPPSLVEERNKLASKGYHQHTAQNAFDYLKNDGAIAAMLAEKAIAENAIPLDGRITIGYLADGGAVMANELKTALSQHGVVSDVIAVDSTKQWLNTDQMKRAREQGKIILCDDVISTGQQIMHRLLDLNKADFKGEVTVLSNRILYKACDKECNGLRDFVEHSGLWKRANLSLSFPVKVYAAHISSKPWEMIDTADSIKKVAQALHTGDISLSPEEAQWIQSLSPLLVHRSHPDYKKNLLAP